MQTKEDQGGGVGASLRGFLEATLLVRSAVCSSRRRRLFAVLSAVAAMWSSLTVRTAPAVAAAVTTASVAGGSAAGLLLASFSLSNSEQSPALTSSNLTANAEAKLSQNERQSLE